MPGHDLAQGQLVALAMFTAGCLGLLAVAVRHARAVSAVAVTRVRSVLVGALMVTAGLALLLVRRLDPAALDRVVVDLAAVMPAALPAIRPVSARWKELR
jgi:hypothetical protein